MHRDVIYIARMISGAPSRLELDDALCICLHSTNLAFPIGSIPSERRQSSNRREFGRRSCCALQRLLPVHCTCPQMPLKIYPRTAVAQVSTAPVHAVKEWQANHRCAWGSGRDDLLAVAKLAHPAYAHRFCQQQARASRSLKLQTRMVPMGSAAATRKPLQACHHLMDSLHCH